MPVAKDLYPVFLDLETLHILILGFGEVGRRKLEKLLPARPAGVLVLERDAVDEAGKALLEKARGAGVAVTLAATPFDAGLLDRADLVFACTGDHELNRRVALLCRERHILCNCVDDPPLGTFHVPAMARRGSVCAALSTGGASPALSRRWRAQLEGWVAPRAAMAELLGRLRPRVLALGLGSAENRTIFRSLAAQDLEEALAAGDLALATSLLQQRLPLQLRGCLKELLHDLAPLP